ncbi:MAG TPA: hypothetical protein VKE51_04715 [Vicinamibacterales bacterium]|nr:hypothetical protein [Vicinamibacterales bacterium]
MRDHAFVAAAALTLGFAASGSAQELIPIVTYDISESPRSGFGCWAHAYDGSIVDVGRTVSSSVSRSFEPE